MDVLARETTWPWTRLLDYSIDSSSYCLHATVLQSKSICLPNRDIDKACTCVYLYTVLNRLRCFLHSEWICAKFNLDCNFTWIMRIPNLIVQCYLLLFLWYRNKIQWKTIGEGFTWPIYIPSLTSDWNRNWIALNNNCNLLYILMLFRNDIVLAVFMTCLSPLQGKLYSVDQIKCRLKSITFPLCCGSLFIKNSNYFWFILKLKIFKFLVWNFANIFYYFSGLCTLYIS